MDAPTGVGKMVAVLFAANETLSRQNDALQMMLLNRGLTQRAIQKEMAGYLKDRKGRENATRLLTTLAQRIAAILDEIDVEKALAKVQLPNKHKMN